MKKCLFCTRTEQEQEDCLLFNTTRKKALFYHNFVVDSAELIGVAVADVLEVPVVPAVPAAMAAAAALAAMPMSPSEPWGGRPR